MEGISKVFTQKDAELFLKPSIPQVQYGDITTPNRPFYSEAEELMLWSETSYRGPLVPAGNKRYQELFQKIMPKEAAFYKVCVRKKRVSCLWYELQAGYFL